MTSQTYLPTANIQIFVAPAALVNETVLLVQFPIAIKPTPEAAPHPSEKPSCKWVEQDGQIVCRWSFPD